MEVVPIKAARARGCPEATVARRERCCAQLLIVLVLETVRKRTRSPFSRMPPQGAGLNDAKIRRFWDALDSQRRLQLQSRLRSKKRCHLETQTPARYECGDKNRRARRIARTRRRLTRVLVTQVLLRTGLVFAAPAAFNVAGRCASRFQPPRSFKQD